MSARRIGDNVATVVLPEIAHLGTVQLAKGSGQLARVCHLAHLSVCNSCRQRDMLAAADKVAAHVQRCVQVSV